MQAHGDFRHGAQGERRSVKHRGRARRSLHPSVKQEGCARRSKQGVRLRLRCHVSLLVFSSQVSGPPALVIAHPLYCRTGCELSFDNKIYLNSLW